MSRINSAVIRHGEDDATIFIKIDDGLEIDRKLRTNKADYLKVRKADQAVPSTEKFLRQFLKGELFKPLEFCTRTSVEQAKIILNLLEIPLHLCLTNIVFGLGKYAYN